MITAAELHDILILDEEQGKLFWKSRDISRFPDARAWKIWNTRYANQEALTANDGSGYLRGDIFDAAYRAHRVIWAMVYGVWPEGQIDHIDGNRANNKPSNLRDVSPGENGKNKQISRRNKSGYQGVYFNSRLKKWQAQIACGGKYYNLGIHKNFDDALRARKQGEIDLCFSPNHGRAIRPAKAAA